MRWKASKKVVKDANLLGDLRDSVSEASDVRSGEAGKSKEPGMG